MSGSAPAPGRPAPAVRLLLARFTEYDRAAWIGAARRWLAEDELARAQEIPDASVRASRLIGWAMMRQLVARHTGHPPPEVTVVRSALGKPEFPDAPGLWVSVAHAGRLVVVAASASAPVGVDAEGPARSGTPAGELVRRRFALSEAAHFAALPERQREGELLRFWTAKEAVGKAIGCGIAPALSGVVLAREGAELRLESVCAGPAGPPARDWSLRHLAAPDGGECVAVALAAPGALPAPPESVTREALAAGTI